MHHYIIDNKQLTILNSWSSQWLEIHQIIVYVDFFNVHDAKTHVQIIFF